MTNKTIIFLNGCPRSGKDMFSLESSLEHGTTWFAKVLKERAWAAFGLNVPWHYFEDCKDVPHAWFNGATPREVMIAYSEDFIKPVTKNRAHFGEIVRDEIKTMSEDLIYIPDSGFKTEVQCVATEFGIENCLQVRLHRRGFTFAGDSRTHWEVDGLERVDVHNNGGRSELTTEIDDIILAFNQKKEVES